MSDISSHPLLTERPHIKAFREIADGHYPALHWAVWVENWPEEPRFRGGFDWWRYGQQPALEQFEGTSIRNVCLQMERRIYEARGFSRTVPPLAFLAMRRRNEDE